MVYTEQALDPDDGDDDEAIVIPRPEHPISRKLIDENALKVLYRLNKAGYRAYMVGGSVRDLLLERTPKDFDVSTDAEPGQIRRLFRNARIIGRRFRLAHILFKEGVVEVATFRRQPDPDEQDREPGDLLITSDNNWGSPREDAFRRDFTVNALFYNIDDFSVIDYVGGIADLRAGLIRVIGDPDLRFQEDPVRMMRACEFAGRLGFTIEPRTQQAIQDNREEILKASPARLTEELLQMLRTGAASVILQWMLDLGLLEVLLPEVFAIFEASRRGAGDFGALIPTLDRCAREGDELDDSVLLATLLFPEVMLARFEVEMEAGAWMSPDAFRDVSDTVFQRFTERFSLPNQKRGLAMRALEGFHRMCGQRFKSPEQRLRFAGRAGFSEALELFELVAEATGQGGDVLARWRQVAARRGDMPPEDLPRPRRPRRRRRRRPRRRPGEEAT
ncbi:MAG: polynucleotide adenylyltransferase PcnB [Acidobacteriota bacterium]